MKTTLISKARTINLNQMAVVCDLLGWSEQQYCDHQFEVYEKLIEQFCEHLPKEKDLFRYSPIFRGFFNHTWTERNEQDFLPFANDLTRDFISLDMDFNLLVDEGRQKGDYAIVSEYKFIHDPNRLCFDTSFNHQLAYVVEKLIDKYK